VPRTAEKNEALREETRSKILETALRVFAARGYDQTSVKQIAQEAGIAQGLLYHYFDSKEHLLQSVFARCMAEVGVSFAAGEGEGTASQKLERLIWRSFALVQEQRDFWRLTYATRFQPDVLAGLAPALGEWVQMIRQTLEAHLQAVGAANPAADAVLLFAAIDGISQHYVMEPDSYPLEAVTDALIARFCPKEANV
jgi:AcrR family transcriptional regulator